MSGEAGPGGWGGVVMSRSCRPEPLVVIACRIPPVNKRQILIGGNNNFWTVEISKYLPITYVVGVGLKDGSGSHAIWNDSLSDQKRG